MDILKGLTSEKDLEFVDNLLLFLENFETHLSFKELNEGTLRKDIWESIFKRLRSAAFFTIHEQCLRALRILSRDKTDLNELVSDERLLIIVKNAGLADQPGGKGSCASVIVESLKLLCNLLYNCTAVQEKIGDTPCLRAIVARMGAYQQNDDHKMKLFDARILFLTTALNVPLRNVIKNELNGDERLIQLLDALAIAFESDESTIDSNNVVLACEILKVLFNLYINSEESENEGNSRHKNLVEILYKLLVNGQSQKYPQEDELLSHIVNLLMVLPCNGYDPMIQPLRGNQFEIPFMGMDLCAIDRLLKFFHRRLNAQADLVENISPITISLIRLVKSLRLARKYVRLEILPPLEDVLKRPEEGSTLRAKLCQLLTYPIAELSDLVAELIFVLCKENVNRMVKYTGYGNAAGMFANRGLLGCQSRESGRNPSYSSESEDSDTEEYVKYKESINPVTGCYEQPKPNPLEGMSDEQKEYEAMKLVGLVDQLTRQGVVQPCRIGEDGKPQPIEHILQLQEEMPKLNIKQPE